MLQLTLQLIAGMVAAINRAVGCSKNHVLTVHSSLQQLCKFEPISTTEIIVINIHDVCDHTHCSGPITRAEIIAATRCTKYFTEPVWHQMG